MGSKNISIRDEAYDLLKSMKLGDESFSDTIIRLLSKHSDLKELYGAGTREAEEYDREIQEISGRRQTFSREVEQ